MDGEDPAATVPTRYERWLTDLSALAIIVLCCVITITVVSRWIYRSLIPDDVLLVRELMVLVILLPMAAVSAKRAQIAVTVFTKSVKGRGDSFLKLLGNTAGLCFAGVLFIAALRMLSRSWESGDYYDGDLYIPMWVGNAFYALGLFAFLVRLVSNWIADIQSVVRG